MTMQCSRTSTGRGRSEEGEGMEDSKETVALGICTMSLNQSGVRLYREMCLYPVSRTLNSSIA